MSKELEKCPFCGSEAKMSEHKGNWDSDSYEPEKVAVWCTNGECLLCPELVIYAESAGYGYFPVDKEKAVNVWNTRTESAELEGLRKDSTELIKEFLDYADPLHPISRKAKELLAKLNQ